MIIIVDGHQAVLKNDYSFEYIAENRLFMGRDGYTLNISFPLKDCPENLEIFGKIYRPDVAKNKVSFDCSIVTGTISLFGALLVVKVSDVEVECQFAEGRCAQAVCNPLDDILISELPLGQPPATNPETVAPSQAWKSIDQGASEVALPWVNENYPTAPNNWVQYADGSYSWDSEVKALSWQPYLIVIARRICTMSGYTANFTEWEESPFRFLIICNSLPATWYMPEYAKALPQWSVSEFFDKLELLLMCEFDFNHKEKTVSMHFSKNVLSTLDPIELSDIVDSYSDEISHDESSKCEYIATKRFAYKETNHSMAKYYACDWYVNNCTMVKRYPTLQELIESNKRRDVYSDIHKLIGVQWGEPMGDDYDPRMSTLNALLYAEDVDTYFVFRAVATEFVTKRGVSDLYTQVYILQPVNVFGSGAADGADSSTEEIELVPVCINDTYISKDDNRGFMMFLNPADHQDSSEVELPSDSSAADSAVTLPEPVQPAAAAAIVAGDKSRGSAFYDEIYLAFWDNFIIEPGKSPCPFVDPIIVTSNWQDRHFAGPSLRLKSSSGTVGIPSVSKLPKINAAQKFKFSWLDDKIPDPRSIFHIMGKRYLCEKITATFSENGMSQLLKGEFYPLIDD